MWKRCENDSSSRRRWLIVRQSQSLLTRYDLKIHSVEGHAQYHSLSVKLQVPLLDRPADTGLTRSMRNRRFPARFQDHVPTSTTPAQMGHPFLTQKQRSEAARARAGVAEPAPEPMLEPPAEEWPDGQADPDAAANQIITDLNSFGVFRKYLSAYISSHNPEDTDPFSDIPSAQPSSVASRSATTESIGSNLGASSGQNESDPLSTSTNPTRDLLLGWWSTEGSREGIGSLGSLVNCLTHPRFDVSDLQDFNPVSALRQFERTNISSTPETTLAPGDGWKTGTVKIKVPCTGVKQREEDAPEFTIGGVLYRDAVEVIANELKDPESFENLHIKPFEEWWKPEEDDDPVRVYSEVYTSDAMLEAERDLQSALKTTPGPQLEMFIVSALLYSDSTSLASFGSASLWPVYLFIGNLSKYVRSKPTSLSAHHIAYLPTVRDQLNTTFHTSHLSSSFRTRSTNFTWNTTAPPPQLICSPTSSGS